MADNMRPTPVEWVDHFLASDRQRREEIASYCIRAVDNSERCWFGNHEGKIEQLASQRAKALEALRELYRDRSQFSPSAEKAVTTIVNRVAATLGATIWP